MNLHEECLLKYLLNTMHLFQSTENLQNINELIKKRLENESLRNVQIGYSGNT